ncbi:MAG TPA: SDR family oxidoreductase [Acidimicrobiales bacterium]|jgi:NAD(P)-dependent dehydrogenase (short-subunit alcohol dehydrogenase family)|nr:SDR family oxidoreductase [Acidimicrobiales bacterium]
MAAGRLTDRVAIVTGGAQGLGLGIARRFAEEGARVVIADIAEDAAAKAAASIGGVHVACDVTRRESVQAMVDGVVERYGQLDVMVANAGIAGGAPFLELTDERWDSVIAVNLRGVFLCNQIAGRQFVAQGTGGAIINTASILSARANPTTAAYSASKAAVVSLTHSAAASLGQYGVRVNAIGPGYIETQMTAGIRDDANLSQSVRDATVLGRFGVPGDIGDAAVFLASDESSYVTGQVLYVDGGWLLHRNPSGEQMQRATVSGLATSARLQRPTDP